MNNALGNWVSLMPPFGINNINLHFMLAATRGAYTRRISMEVLYRENKIEYEGVFLFVPSFE